MPLTTILRRVIFAAFQDRPVLNVRCVVVYQRALKLRSVAERMNDELSGFLIHLNRATVKADDSEFPY